MNEENKLGDPSKQKIWCRTGNENERGETGRIKHKLIQSVFVTHAPGLPIPSEQGTCHHQFLMIWNGGLLR